MGSIAVGFGTMLAAPSKALYAVAVRKNKSPDTETSSIFSDRSADSDSGLRSIKKSVLRSLSGGTSMKKTNSDQSDQSITPPLFHHTDSMEYVKLKKDMGKGFGKVLKATAEGAPSLYEVMLTSSSC
jgi:hypothetical protein